MWRRPKLSHAPPSLVFTLRGTICAVEWHEGYLPIGRATAAATATHARVGPTTCQRSGARGRNTRKNDPPSPGVYRAEKGCCHKTTRSHTHNARVGLRRPTTTHAVVAWGGSHRHGRSGSADAPPVSAPHIAHFQ